MNKFKFKNKNVIISGGAGFLGSWLCDTLVSLGAKVICIDDLSTGLDQNINHLKDNRNFQFIQKNVSNLDNSFEDTDLILHLASRASPEDYQQNPIDTLNANSEIAEAKFFKPKEIPDKLAFDHSKMIKDYYSVSYDQS